MCTGRGSNQGPLGPKSDALTTVPLRHLGIIHLQKVLHFVKRHFISKLPGALARRFGNMSASNASGPEFDSLRERLRTHNVFTKGQCFYLNYHKFSIKSYVLDVY